MAREAGPVAHVPVPTDILTTILRMKRSLVRVGCRPPFLLMMSGMAGEAALLDLCRTFGPQIGLCSPEVIAEHGVLFRRVMVADVELVWPIGASVELQAVAPGVGTAGDQRPI